ncbi:MAG: TipAS antibiotic-recognition domain-containing protein [Clostridia bacterium]|nr:TipAS antibiotic-recognition domain-containing protein [Clostridia bacterium]MBQ4602888.1 TipAS antibiotic-recognition domain-containing protein [Clostridia bacterium]
MNNNYKFEARERWGGTEVYREHSEKTKNYSKEKWADANNGLMAVFAAFADCKSNGFTTDTVEAQDLVHKLKAHITENYYTCTDEILCGLGKMYVCDERFKNNINKNGDGTAEFAAEAIEIYCEDRK